MLSPGAVKQYCSYISDASYENQGKHDAEMETLEALHPVFKGDQRLAQLPEYMGGRYRAPSLERSEHSLPRTRWAALETNV